MRIGNQRAGLDKGHSKAQDEMGQVNKRVITFINLA